MPTPSPATRTLEHLYLPLVAALIALGIGLRTDALYSGFFADDYAQLAMREDRYPVQRPFWDLFNLSDGSVAEGDRLMRSGFYPWWSDPEVRLAMFRPLASSLIAVDHALFGSAALPYHVHSLVWWCGMLVAVAVLFRRLLPPLAALAAFGLFVLDEAHGVPLAWIANRCALASTLFGAAALAQYLRFRASGASAAAWRAALLYTLALGFGEYALCMLGFFLAYELLDRAALPQRARAFVWVLAPALGYLALRALLHENPRGSGVYLDPFSEPMAFARVALIRIPLLMSDLLLGARGDYWTFGFPWTHTFVELGIASREWLTGPDGWRGFHVWLGFGAVFVYIAMCAALWRVPRFVPVRFLALGCVISLVPVTGSFPSSRLLLIPLLGFAPVLALVLEALVAQLRGRGIARAALPALCVSVLVLAHVGLAGWVSHAEAGWMRLADGITRQALATFEADPARLPAQTVIMLAASEGNTSSYLPYSRRRHGLPAPRACFTLSFVPAPLELTRTADNAFVISYRGPFRLMDSLPEQMLRSPQLAFAVGDVVALGVFQAQVLQVVAGRPERVLFTFAHRLEDPALLFVLPTLYGIRQFPLPRVGESVIVPVPLLPPPA
ncbi:MAG: hypothetical protein ABW321_29860 [Polyangiales bacterium]